MAFWAFIPFIFAFWWLASGVPPTSCQKRFVFPRSHIKNLTAPGRAPFSDFWPLGLHFLLFGPCGPSFLAVSFPFILPFWVFICLIFAFWAFISFILAFWAFISFHCGLLGLHSLYFCLLVASFWGPTHKLPKTVRFPKVPHKEFNSARPSSIFRFLAFGASFPFIWALWAFIPCSLALWAFISIHFGLFGVSFWPPPTSCQKWPVCPTSLQWIYQRRDRLHFAVFSILGLHFLYFGLVGLHFLAFWPCGPSFPCILAFSGSASGPPPTSCQNDGMRSVQGPGGFNVLFYDGMRSVQGPGGFNVLFYFCYDVSHSATEVKKPKKVFHYVMGSFGWVGCCQSNFNTWWGAILQTPMNPKTLNPKLIFQMYI